MKISEKAIKVQHHKTRQPTIKITRQCRKRSTPIWGGVGVSSGGGVVRSSNLVTLVPITSQSLKMTYLTSYLYIHVVGKYSVREKPNFPWEINERIATHFPHWGHRTTTLKSLFLSFQTGKQFSDMTFYSVSTR